MSDGEIDWIDYGLTDSVAAIDRQNEDAWIQCRNPLEVER